MKRSLSLFSLLLIIFALVGTLSFGQGKALATNTNAPVVDGVVKTGEYSFSQDMDQLSLYANRTADALTIGVVGATKGWVSFGLGSMRMDGSTIFIGFVGPDGKVQFKPQIGSGHRHSDASKDVASTIISYAMKQDGGKTTLEVALKPAAYIKPGQKALEVIWGVGTEPSFTPRHMSRGAVSLALAQ